MIKKPYIWMPLFFKQHTKIIPCIKTLRGKPQGILMLSVRYCEMRRHPIYSCLVMVCLLFLMVDYAYAIGMREAYPVRRYILGGGITLSYGRVESDDAEPDETFTQRYTLGLLGYIVHPRLITFNLNTSYSKEEGTTRESQNLSNSIWLNILPYKPLNLSLRYSRTDSDTGNDYNAYGLTLTYQRPIISAPGGMSKYKTTTNGDRDKGFITQLLPVITVFDIDRIEYTDSSTTLLALRLKGRYKKTGYDAGSSYSRDERNGEDRDRTEVFINTYTSLGVLHSLSVGGDYEVSKDGEDTSSLFLYGSLSGKNKNNDMFYGFHMEVQSFTERQDMYLVSTNVEKVHALPENLNISYSGSAFYRTADEDNYGLSGSVNASKPLSNVVRMSAGAGITVGDIGSFNLSTRFYERLSSRFDLRQYYQTNYRYGSSLSEDDSGFSHRIGASADMRLHRRLYSSVDVNYYTKHNLQTLGGSISAGTWFWRFGLSSGIGASTTTSDGEEYENYEAYMNLRGNIMKGLYISVDTRYVYQSEDELKRRIVKPYLTWNWRRLSMRFEYEYTNEESMVMDERTTQRVFFSVTRSFGRVFYR